MDRLFEVLVLGLATWRLASLLANEYGPFDVFARLRSFLGVVYNEHSLPEGSNWLAKGVICVLCNSVWIGTFWAALYFVWPDSWWLALPFALSTVAIITEQYVGWN